MHQQIALIASSSEGAALTAWDVETASLLTSYRGSSSSRNCFTLLGRDYLVASQTSKGALHFYTWHKEQLLHRSFAPEALTALAASLSGAFVAGGGASGTVYLWETGSGLLLRSWPAHYKAVAAMAFSQDGCLLLTGGEDTTVNTWQLVDLLDASLDQQAAQQRVLTPLHSWSEHTLPVTGLHVGAGQLDALVVTSSLDRTCKVWSLAQGVLLHTLTFQAAIHSLAINQASSMLYAGDSAGRIAAAQLAAQPAHSSSDGMGSAHAGSCSSDGAHAVMHSHSLPVCSMAFTSDATQLVSGSEDGTVVVWDLHSRQPVRTLGAAKGPVTAVLVTDRPLFLPGGHGRRGLQLGAPGAGHTESSSPAAAKAPERPQPLAPFQKYVASPAGHGTPAVLDGSVAYRGVISTAGLPDLIPSERQQGDQHGAGEGPASTALAAAEALQQQNDRLQHELQEARAAAVGWKRLHGQLHQLCVDRLLPADVHPY